MDHRTLEAEIRTHRVPEPHVSFGLPLLSDSVPCERDLERGGKMEDDVGRRDISVQPTLERSQDTTSRRSTGRKRQMPQLRSIRSTARIRRIPVAQHDRPLP
jgi:hypothetical protein